MDPETINAISNLWLLALIVLLIVGVILFYKQIRSALDRLIALRFRRGDTELSSEFAKSPPVEAEPPAYADERATPPQLEVESREESVVVEPGTQSDPFDTMIFAFLRNDILRGEEAYKQLQEAEANAVQKLRNKAVYLYLRYKSGDTSAFEQLQNLAEEENLPSEILPTVYNFIGNCYDLGDNFLKAAEAYEAAAEAAQSEEDRATYIASAAGGLFAAGSREEAFNRVTQEIDKTSTPKALSTLYTELASLYEKTGDSELRAIALEKAIEYQPNDTDLRFGAAYSYSENDLSTLALMHYQTLLEFKPDDTMALNNLGVTYGELNMPVKRSDF